MTTAREVITGALTFHLNRLSPGEALDADTASVCLSALNDIVDEFNGVKSQLYREVFTLSGAGIVGTSGTLGTTWASLSPGDEILGATTQYTAGLDVPLDPLTMGQYQNISLKSTGSIPRYYAHDGAATVYFWPACTGQTVSLRTKAAFSDFADLDTNYVLPKGYKSALSALVAERVAGVTVGGIPPTVAVAARAARMRLAAQASNPAIIGPRRDGGNILAGW